MAVRGQGSGDSAAMSRSSALLGTRLTFGGIITLAVILTIGAAGLSQDANLLLLLFGVSCGIAGFNAIAPLWILRGIEVERTVSEAAVAGRPFKIVYTVRNCRRWTHVMGVVIRERAQSRRIASLLPPVFISALAPGEERRLEVVICLPCRGRFPLSAISISSRFPFGIFSCGVDFAASADLVVYPALGRFRSDPWKEQRFGGGAPQRATESGQDEFYGVREYRQGDNLRWVHWKSSARRGIFVVREMMPLRPRQLIVLLDPWPEPAHEAAVWGQGNGGPGSGFGAAAKLRRVMPERFDHIAAERVISAAATALCEGVERGYRVGLVCRSAVPVVVPPAAGRQQRQRLLQELALIEPPGGEPLLELLARVRWPSGWHSRCLVCAGHFTAKHQAVLKFLGGRAEAVMMLSADSESFEPAPEPARIAR